MDEATTKEEWAASRNNLFRRSRDAMVKWADDTFSDVPISLFGSLSYRLDEEGSRVESTAKKGATIFLERVLSRVSLRICKRTPKRIFIVEQSKGGILNRTVWGLHFLMEPPAGMPLEQFKTLCRQQWLNIRHRHDVNPRENSVLVDIQETRSERSVGHYISKTWFTTGGSCLLVENNYEWRMVKGHPLSLCVVS